MKPNPNPSPNPLRNPLANNQTKPNQTQTTPASRTRGGISRGRVAVIEGGKNDELPPLRDQLAAEYTWAEQHLPEEHSGFVVSAMCSLRFAGVKVTTGSVRARLMSTGRDRVACEARAAKYGGRS